MIATIRDLHRGLSGPILGALLVVGCAADANRSERLLDRLSWSGPQDLPEEIVFPDGEATRTVPTRGPAPVRLGSSLREGVVCREGVSWRVPVEVGSDARLSLVYAWLGKGRIVASVAFVSGGERRSLLEEEVPTRRQWNRRTLDLPTDERRGEIVLSCRGRGLMAFAEPYLLGDRPEKTPPNLVLVSLDTLRADHLSYDGYERPTSPRLDELASRAVVFRNAISSSSWTLPTHGTMLTGLLPAQHGATRVERGLPGGVLAVAEMLRTAGYRTVAFTDGGLLDPRWGLAQGFDRYETTPGEPWLSKDAAVVFGAAEEWLRENRFEPYFLFVHTYETHQPYENREGFADPFLEPGYEGRFADAAAPDSVDPGPISAADLRRIVALYDGEIRRLDHYLGRFLDTLEASGGGRAGLVITSDHGEEFLEHGHVGHGHGKLYDENVRVPLIVRRPGGGEGRVSATPVTTADVVPTLLALADLPIPANLPGSSLLDLAPDRPRVSFAHGFHGRIELEEQWMRIDDGDLRLLQDLERGELRWLRRSATGEWKPEEETPHGPEAAVVRARLCAALAWASRGELSVVLPDGATRFGLEEEPVVRLRGLWDGADWREAPVEAQSGEELAITASPACAVLARGEGPPLGDPVPAWWTDGVGTRRSIALRPPPASRAAWSPLHRTVPPPGLLFPNAPVTRSPPVEWTREAIEELRALGYL